MIEITFIDYLKTVLDVPILAERPAENIPDSYVLIDLTSMSRENFIWSSRIAFQSYAPTLYEAASLNDRVIEAVLNSTILNAVASARLNSAYNFTDTATKFYRYQAVFDITHY